MAEGGKRIRVSVPSDVRFLGAIRSLVQEACGIVGFSETETADVQLAVQEGCSNVIRHCYGNCSDKRLDVAVVFAVDALEIRVDDYGTFVDPSRMKGRELDDVRPGGLGVHLMRKAMDEVRYERNAWGGTTLTLRKRLPGRDAGRSGPRTGQE